MRLFLAALVLPALSWGTIWPDAIGAFQRAATTPVSIQDRAVWDEYGLKESEGARYESGKESFTVTGFRTAGHHRRPGRFRLATAGQSKDVQTGPAGRGDRRTDSWWFTATTC